MLKIFQKYNPRANSPSTDYPHGSIKNATAHDIEDGTPLDDDHGNDYVGYDAALMAQAGLSPDGNPDKATDSQRLAAVNHIAGSVFEGLSAAVSEIAARPTHFPVYSEVTTLSSLTVAEASGQGVTWPVFEGAAMYIVVPAGTGVPDGVDYINAGTQRQLRRVLFGERLKNLFVNGQAGQADSEFRNNGQQRTYNDQRYLLKSNNLADLTVKLAAMQNLGIYAGRIQANGTELTLPAGWSSSRGGPSSGHITVTHNLNTLAYVVIPIVQRDTGDNLEGVATLKSLTLTSFSYSTTTGNANVLSLPSQFILIKLA